MYPIQPSKKVFLIVLTPDGRGECRAFEVNAEESVEQILERFSPQCRVSTIEKDASVFAQEMLYEGLNHTRKALKCFNEQQQRLQFIDGLSADEIDQEASEYILRRYVRLNCPPPVTPTGIPSLVIRTQTECYEVNSDRRLVQVPLDALTDQSFVALIWGIRCGKKFYWEIAGGHFLDDSIGDTFPNPIVIPGTGERRHVLCLMRDGEQPPRVRLPRRKFLTVFYRYGCDAKMVAGKLSTKTPTDIERWTMSYELTSFDSDFSLSAKKK